MKGMNLKSLVVVLTALYLLFLATPATAAVFDPASAARAERDHLASKGGYYGYVVNKGDTIQKSKAVYSYLYLSNSKKTAKVVVICQNSGKMSYKLNGKESKHADIEKFLSKYSSKSEQRTMMIAKSATVLGRLESYAKLHRWIFSYEESVGKDEVYAKVTFSNTDIALKASVVTRRQRNKYLVTHFFVEGREVPEDYLYKWLSRNDCRFVPLYAYSPDK